MKTKDPKSIQIGIRIRFFRERANISQLKLETEAGMSPGALSKIENGFVNPTKETLLDISEILDLSIYEQAYLIGSFDRPLTPKDVEKINTAIHSRFSGLHNFAYLLDYHYRLFSVSNGFDKLAKLAGVEYKNLIGKSLIEIMFNPEFPMRKLMDKNFDQVVTDMIGGIWFEREFLKLEPEFQNDIERFKTLPDFNRIFTATMPLRETYTLSDTFKISFKLPLLTMYFEYAASFLREDPRFLIVQYRLLNPLALKKLQNANRQN